MYLFFMQMAQIPLIALGRVPAIKRNTILVRIPLVMHELNVELTVDE